MIERLLNVQQPLLQGCQCQFVLGFGGEVATEGRHGVELGFGHSDHSGLARLQ